jgi:hypothetical protein
MILMLLWFIIQQQYYRGLPIGTEISAAQLIQLSLYSMSVNQVAALIAATALTQTPAIRLVKTASVFWVGAKGV